MNVGDEFEIADHEINVGETVVDPTVIRVPTLRPFAIPIPPDVVMAPVVVDVESVDEVAEKDVNKNVPVTVKFVIVVVDNVDVPDTDNKVPIQRLFAIPTPPEMITLPVIEEVASVVDDVVNAYIELVPVAVNPVVEIAANVLEPVTFNVVPIVTEVPTHILLAIPAPPAVVMDPVVVDVASVVEVVTIDANDNVPVTVKFVMVVVANVLVPAIVKLEFPVIVPTMVKLPVPPSVAIFVAPAYHWNCCGAVLLGILNHMVLFPIPIA